MNLLRLATAALCVGSVAFLLRVLAGFVREGRKNPPRNMKAYWAKFHPSTKPGELVVMDVRVQKSKVVQKNGTRIALAAVLAAGLGLPIHSQPNSQIAERPSAGAVVDRF